MWVQELGPLWSSSLTLNRSLIRSNLGAVLRSPLAALGDLGAYSLRLENYTEGEDVIDSGGSVQIAFELESLRNGATYVSSNPDDRIELEFEYNDEPTNASFASQLGTTIFVDANLYEPIVVTLPDVAFSSLGVADLFRVRARFKERQADVVISPTRVDWRRTDYITINSLSMSPNQSQWTFLDPFGTTHAVTATQQPIVKITGSRQILPLGQRRISPHDPPGSHYYAALQRADAIRAGSPVIAFDLTAQLSVEKDFDGPEVEFSSSTNSGTYSAGNGKYENLVVRWNVDTQETGTSLWSLPESRVETFSHSGQVNGAGLTRFGWTLLSGSGTYNISVTLESLYEEI